MKLTNFKKKTAPTVRAKANESPSVKMQKFADNQGRLYALYSEEEHSAGRKKKEVNDAVKATAMKYGATVGKKKLIEGQKYVVGVQEVDSFQIDQSEAERLIPEKLLATLYAPRVIDKGRFEQAVDSGKISRVVAAKIVKKGASQFRIVVSLRKGNPKP